MFWIRTVAPNGMPLSGRLAVKPGPSNTRTTSPPTSAASVNAPVSSTSVQKLVPATHTCTIAAVPPTGSAAVTDTDDPLGGAIRPMNVVRDPDGGGELIEPPPPPPPQAAS